MLSARAWLFGGNTVARIGILVLLIGLSFLAKYAADVGLFPPPARVILIALVAITLLLVGWRLRGRRPGFAALLQGAAVAALYLDVFAAFRLLQLLPASLAFGLSVAIVAFSGVLAVRQNALSLAVIGAAGGFAAPLLMSTGQGSHVGLFSYYLVLDLGIAAIARYRSWRVLYLLGFSFTFVIGGLWAGHYYRPAFYPTVQPFLAAFVLLFLAIVIIEARKTPTQLTHAIDGTLVFGLLIVGFGAQLALVHEMPWASAWSAVGFGATYLLAAAATRRLTSLGNCSPQRSASPFCRWPYRWGSTTGSRRPPGPPRAPGALWFGLRHQRRLAVFTGIALQLVAAVLLLERIDHLSSTTPMLNARWIGVVLIVSPALFSAWSLRQAQLDAHPRWLHRSSPMALARSAGLGRSVVARRPRRRIRRLEATQPMQPVSPRC